MGEHALDWSEMDDPMTPPVSDPIAETSESHELALLAARAFAASRRPLSGAPLDATDLAALASVADLLESSGPVVEYFTSFGQSGKAPSGAVASRLDVTIDAIVDSNQGAANLQDALASIAKAIRQFAASSKPEVAEQLSEFFALLGRAAARRTAVSGETVVAV